ncbi:hypothetical protein [Luteimonas sp. J29]|uniref:hypothetical protein n=1 Tax=Luteimonas sp. J29 TaxID=935863 RepID=UPI000479DE3B|nr:hypothetical protein [Luteimonas sp. J29]
MARQIGQYALPALPQPRDHPGRAGLHGGLGFAYGRLSGLEVGLGAGRDDPGTDGRHDVAVPLPGFGQPSGRLSAALAQVRLHGALVLCEGLGGAQARAYGRQEAVLGRGPGNPQPGAGASLLGVCAAVVVAVDNHHGAVAQPAAQDAGQDVLRRPTGAAAGGAALQPQAALHGRPRAGVDDGQLGVLGDHPLRLGTLLAHASAGVGVLHPAAAVPDLPASVDGVGEDADAAAHVAGDGRRRPGAAARRGHPVPVQAGDDLARRPAGQVLGVDPADDLGLVLADLALAGGADAVAVRQAAGAGAVERAAHEAAMGLLAQVVEVELAHEAAQAHLGLVALPAGVQAVADADDAHAGEGESARGLRRLDAVARQAGEVVDQDHVEPRRVGEQAQVSRPVVAGAGDGGVGVDHRLRPAHARGVLAAVAQLVLERGLALGVGRVAGVGGDVHGSDPTPWCP